MSDDSLRPENRPPPFPNAAPRAWPEGDPYAPAFGEGSDPKKAKGRLLIPGVLIVMLGVLNLVPGVGCISFGLFAQSIPDVELERGMKGQMNAQQWQEAQQGGMDAQWAKGLYLYSGVGCSLFSLLVAVAAMVGGGCMIAGRSMFLCVVGAVAAMLSPAGCFVFGFAIGVWALVVLLSEEVRAAFRAA